MKNYNQQTSRRNFLKTSALTTGGLILAPAIITAKPEKTLWNTACYYVANDTSKPIMIIDGESQGNKLFIPNGRIQNFKGVNFPWCSNTEEIVNKAFQVYVSKGSDKKPKGGAFLFYLFQDFKDNQIYYSKNRWEDKTLCADSAEGAFNVLINSKGTPWCSQY